MYVVTGSSLSSGDFFCASFWHCWGVLCFFQNTTHSTFWLPIFLEFSELLCKHWLQHPGIVVASQENSFQTLQEAVWSTVKRWEAAKTILQTRRRIIFYSYWNNQTNHWKSAPKENRSSNEIWSDFFGYLFWSENIFLVCPTWSLSCDSFFRMKRPETFDDLYLTLELKSSSALGCDSFWKENEVTGWPRFVFLRFEGQRNGFPVCGDDSFQRPSEGLFVAFRRWTISSRWSEHESMGHTDRGAFWGILPTVWFRGFPISG